MTSSDFTDKLDLIQSIERELWQFRTLDDLTTLRRLIRERRTAANQKLYAAANARTGASAAAAQERLTKNAAEFLEGGWDNPLTIGGAS